VDWSYLSQHMVLWRALVKTVINHVSIKGTEFLNQKNCDP
jgi:hypothetical protein